MLRKNKGDARTFGQAESPRNGGFRDVAGLSGEGKELGLGIDYQADSVAGKSQVVAGVWEVLSGVGSFLSRLQKGIGSIKGRRNTCWATEKQTFVCNRVCNPMRRGENH